MELRYESLVIFGVLRSERRTDLDKDGVAEASGCVQHNAASQRLECVGSLLCCCTCRQRILCRACCILLSVAGGRDHFFWLIPHAFDERANQLPHILKVSALVHFLYKATAWRTFEKWLPGAGTIVTRQHRCAFPSAAEQCPCLQELAALAPKVLVCLSLEMS